MNSPRGWTRPAHVALGLVLGFIVLWAADSLGRDKQREARTSNSAGKWRKYENARFGFVLTYPAALVGSRESDNGDGREFHTRDHEFSVTAVAHFFVPDTGDSFETRWKGELETAGVTITYKRKTESWYVVSGLTKDGTEYYHKFMRQGKNWAAFQITYPHAKRDNYVAWVERIEKEFIPFRAGDYDRLN